MNASAEPKAKQPEVAPVSSFFCIIAGVIAIGAGIYLASLDSANGSSLISAGENGIGWYCIAKGLFMVASPFQFRGVARHLWRD